VSHSSHQTQDLTWTIVHCFSKRWCEKNMVCFKF